jgi:hypothetical protein
MKNKIKEVTKIFIKLKEEVHYFLLNFQLNKYLRMQKEEKKKKHINTLSNIINSETK